MSGIDMAEEERLEGEALNEIAIWCKNNRRKRQAAYPLAVMMRILREERQNAVRAEGKYEAICEALEVLFGKQ